MIIFFCEVRASQSSVASYQLEFIFRALNRGIRVGINHHFFDNADAATYQWTTRQPIPNRHIVHNREEERRASQLRRASAATSRASAGVEYVEVFRWSGVARNPQYQFV